MARRSSARLRNRNSSTPKRVSLSHDATAQTPRTAPVKLSTLREDAEMPGAFPSSISPSPRESFNNSDNHVSTVPVRFDNSTPKNATAIKPAEEEMHPKQHQQSTAKPLEEARWLGFSNMGQHSEPTKHASKIAILQGTPTKAAKAVTVTRSPQFQFTFGREPSLELSPEARKFMEEKREEAARIRDQMVADGKGMDNATEAVQRKIALPKGKKGRFSEVHMEQFKRMDSIANHASAFRADLKRSKTDAIAMKTPAEEPPSQQITWNPPKSLKRSPSKAQLDEPDTIEKAIAAETSKPKSGPPASSLPRSASSITLRAEMVRDPPSPTKRVKRSAARDISVYARVSDDRSGSQSATPTSRKALDGAPNEAAKSTLATPTQASLARASSINSVKSSKIPGPMTFCSPSKKFFPEKDGATASTPLLSRSPTKGPLFSDTTVEKSKNMLSPLLMRTPTKVSPFKKLVKFEKSEESATNEAPLLSRTPTKMSVAKSTIPDTAEDIPVSSIPLLTRSPTKITLPDPNASSESHRTQGKPNGAGLVDRFNLLRSSPMKSILRSPQRLYSTDPAKVAAGTHLASPLIAANDKDMKLPTTKEETPTIEKHVDFTSSTKARYERAHSETTSNPSKGPTPPPKSDAEDKASSKPTFAEYPSLPTGEADTIVTPQKRRQTAAPYDFTFTSHGNGIVFGQSPNAPTSATKSIRSSTIRHVSAEPQFPPQASLSTGSKKRKFDFENDKAIDEEIEQHFSDKENSPEDGDDRPAKRKKPNSSEPAASKQASRVPTLGVKPKKTAKESKDSKPKTISKARLNALAQPKRRL